MHAQINSFRPYHRRSSSRILPEVPETLAVPVRAPHLILMTKGAIAEQTGKVERSGLKEDFTAVEIVAEKDPAAYARVIENLNSNAIRPG